MKIVKATTQDSPDIFAWRNDPVSLSMFKSTEPVSLETHTDWFMKSLVNDRRYLYVGFEDGLKVGICRFDLDHTGNVAEISINLNPSARGMNLSHRLLSDSIKTFRQLSKVELVATIKKHNTASIKCFTKCGFIFTRDESEYAFYKLTT